MMIMMMIWNEYTSPLKTLSIVMIFYLPQWIKQTCAKEKDMQTPYKWKTKLVRPSSATVKLHLFILNLNFYPNSLVLTIHENCAYVKRKQVLNVSFVQFILVGH